MLKHLTIVLGAILAIAVADDFDLYHGCSGKTKNKMCIGFDADSNFSQQCVVQKVISVNAEFKYDLPV